MGSCRHNHKKRVLLQRKKCVFLYCALNKVSVFVFLVNLRRISSASPVNVKYDRLVFGADTLLILSAVNDLFQSEYNSLKRRISVSEHQLQLSNVV